MTPAQRAKASKEWLEQYFRGVTMYEGHPLVTVYEALEQMADERMVRVPREPTVEMCERGGDVIREGSVELTGNLRLSLHGWGGYHVYKAMIAAQESSSEGGG